MSNSSPFQDPTTITEAIEETLAFAPNFGPDGLIPAVATDAHTGRLLMVAHMNADALARTLGTGEAWYWSRSRAKLWRKGETSGHTQSVKEVRTDCDQDVIQLIVDQTGPACHTNRQSCFYRIVKSENGYQLLLAEQP
ncbi:MAG: phosphoribosyl-AMP cyclohydrolase [Pseudomonadota bacterium]